MKGPATAGAALLAVLAVEAAAAVSGEYLIEAGYLVDTTVAPSSGPERATPLELRVFGDSTAAGVGSPTVGESLPGLVAQRLAHQLTRPVHVTGLGVSGARTTDVRSEQLPRLAEPKVDVSLLVVGANDVTHATPPPYLRRQTERLLVDTRRRTQGPVVLGGIPRFAGVAALLEPLRSLVDGYAGVLRSVQRRAAEAVDGATFVDIAGLASPRFLGVPEAMSSDGFHPAPVGYGFWADALAPALATAVVAAHPGAH